MDVHPLLHNALPSAKNSRPNGYTFSETALKEIMTVAEGPAALAYSPLYFPSAQRFLHGPASEVNSQSFPVPISEPKTALVLS